MNIFWYENFLNKEKKRDMRILNKILILTIFVLGLSLSAFSATYYSVTSGDPNTLSNWNTVRDGSGIAAGNFTTSGDIFTIQNGHTMTNTAVWSIGVSGTSPVSLIIETGGTLKADFQVVIANTTGGFTLQSGATYIQNNTSSMSGGIFNGNEAFDTNSNFEVRVASTSYPGGSSIGGGGYGNFIVNLTGTSTTAMAIGGSVTVKGNMTVQSTGTQVFAVGNVNNTVLTVNGNYSQTAGTFRVATGGGINIALQVNGNFNLSGGTFDMCGTTGAAACSASAYGDLRVKGDFTVSTITSIARSGSSSSSLVLLNGTTNQNFTVPAGFSFGTGVSFAVFGGSIATLQSNLVLGSLTGSPGISVLGTLNSNGKNISAGKVNVACRSLSVCNSGSGLAFGGTGTLSLTGGTVLTLTNSNTLDVYAGATFNSANSTITTNNSTLSGMTVTGTANLTDTIFNSAGTTLNPIIVNTSASPVAAGTLNVRGTSNITTSGITVSATATFNWTDAGFRPANYKNNLLVTSGTLTLGTSGITNNGTFVMNGTGAACGEGDSLLIRSSTTGTARPWTGTGTFTLTDLDIQDQNSTPALTVASGTNSGNNTNFTFDVCAPTAAGSLLKGRLLTQNGRGLSNSEVMLTNVNTGEIRFVRSGSFGYFTFEDLPSGDFYILNVSSKRYRFEQQSFTLNGDLIDLVLTAQ